MTSKRRKSADGRAPLRMGLLLCKHQCYWSEKRVTLSEVWFQQDDGIPHVKIAAQEQLVAFFWKRVIPRCTSNKWLAPSPDSQSTWFQFVVICKESGCKDTPMYFWIERRGQESAENCYGSNGQECDYQFPKACSIMPWCDMETLYAASVKWQWNSFKRLRLLFWKWKILFPLFIMKNL